MASITVVDIVSVAVGDEVSDIAVNGASKMVSGTPSDIAG